MCQVYSEITLGGVSVTFPKNKSSLTYAYSFIVRPSFGQWKNVSLYYLNKNLDFNLEKKKKKLIYPIWFAIFDIHSKIIFLNNQAKTLTSSF